MLRFTTITILALAALLNVLWVDYFFDLPRWSYALVFLVWLIFTIVGSFHIRWNYHITSLHSNKSSEKNEIALTFDDGPHPEFTPKVLALLKQYNAKATFFCIGKQVVQHQNLVEKMLAQGHIIGNHTYSHANGFGFFSTTKVIAELQQTNKVIKDCFGLEMNLYRPAFGVTNPNIKKALKVTGLQSIGWSIRSLDTTQRPSEKVLKRITKNIGKGDIVLLHDTSEKTIDVLERLLLFLQENNLRSVTVDQLLDLKAYA